MNGSVPSIRSSRALALALFGILLFACSEAEHALDPEPRAIWPEQDLVAVAVMADDRALVVGMAGEIHRTIDAGDSWQLAHVPVVSSLRALAMVDGERGWVVGDGTILRTDDGGLRWRRQRLPGESASMRLVGVSAMDGAHALVVGEDGVVLRTRNGGGSWEEVSAPGNAKTESPVLRNDVFCMHDFGGRCWSVGHGLERLESDEEIWESQALEDFSTISPIHFDLGQVELSGPDEERLQTFVASNRQRRYLDWILEPGIGARELDAMARRRDPSAVFDLITARLQEVRTVIEESGVLPSRIIVLGAPPWDYEDYLDEEARFLDRYWEERLALGSQLRIRLRDRLLLESLSIDRSGLALAVGASGAIVRSADGGGHWQTLPRSTPHDLHAVGFGRRRAVAVGAQGGLWTSQDEGRHWESVAVDGQTDSFDTLRGVSFSPSGGVGVTVGEKGRILRSLDGGETWIELGLAR
jgi:photosystem II stability/assembly factor-like uncharacterized protein